MDSVVKKVLKTIEEAGFKAYVVGGYTRDFLLGKKNYDVDICTNALPKDIQSLFNIKNANNYGGSNLKIGKFNIDITTFRKELKYEGRHPVEIEYINDLTMDLERRDFTINAIAMDSTGNIIDPLKGVEDLHKRQIKSINDPQEKLREDPLRILRAIRFATVIDFEIEESLSSAIKIFAPLVNSLSKERVKMEYSKILSSKNFKKGLECSEKLGINKVLKIEYEEVIFTSDLLGMWAQIKIDKIPFTNSEKSNIIKITEVVNNGEITPTILYKYGLYICTIAGLILGIKRNKINKMYKNLPIKERSEIALKSEEIIHCLNLKNKRKLRNIIEELEECIIEGRVENTFEKIRTYLIQNKGKW